MWMQNNLNFASDTHSRRSLVIDAKIVMAATKLTKSNFIDLSNDACKYSVQLFSSRIAKVGLNRFVSSWNAHSVPNHGIPNVLQHQRPLPRNNTPSSHGAQDAVDEYRRVIMAATKLTNDCT